MQIINVNIIKKTIDLLVEERYGFASNTQLYSLFSLDKKFGLIFLLNIDCDNNLHLKAFEFLKERYSRFLQVSYIYIKNQINELHISNNYIIKPFDGEMPCNPYNYTYNSTPINDIKKYITIIDYVAAGYAPNVNPNLISSLGYSFNYADNKR
jgi:hypothetical protein